MQDDWLNWSDLKEQNLSCEGAGFRKDPHNPSTFRWGIQAGWAKPIFFRTIVH
jgi:hypothetical protein